MRKSFPVVSRTTAGPYRVILREIAVHRPQGVSVEGWEVMVTSTYDPSDSPIQRVNYGRYGYRRGFFRYRPHMFQTPLLQEAYQLAKSAAFDKMLTIVEMLRGVAADLQHA